MSNWTAVCDLNDLTPNTGLCALVEGRQVAIFRQGSERLFAVGNFDPIGGANVLSRGLLAQLGDNITVASPLYKQHYRLTDGQCLEDENVRIPVYRVRLEGSRVQVAL
ncbi:nitrite reductase small subunit NirD [Halioxenophilus sp. WMMB6]|uniref:nitrite reductase small subunit NirD n=1 Tax=Halioxenophilus sp. WMMB6 TaxID=3073815 RepID=UPI00295EE09E|nr:nitrite reductase small subunit NirD [Halioxenophilus sp. WMMB6]